MDLSNYLNNTATTRNAIAKIESGLDYLILATPTGPARDKLTEVAILFAEAMRPHNQLLSPSTTPTKEKPDGKSLESER